MRWYEHHRTGYAFGLTGGKVQPRRATAEVEQAGVDPLDTDGDKPRRYAEFQYGAKPWKTERRVIVCSKASCQSVDSHFVATNLTGLPQSVNGFAHLSRETNFPRRSRELADELFRLNPANRPTGKHPQPGGAVFADMGFPA